ncbi:MAG: hypothetical protein WC863_02935 [Patescibacteria group bacterium]
MKTNPNPFADLINQFYRDIKEITAETALICSRTYYSMTESQIIALYENFGLCLHQQLYSLIGDTRAETAGPNTCFSKINLILESITEDDAFQKSAFYWSQIQFWIKYPNQEELDAEIDKLKLIIQKTLALRLTKNQSNGKLILLSLAYLLWLEQSIPTIRAFGVKHDTHIFWSTEKYFITFLPSLQQHNRLLMEAAKNSNLLGIEKEEWWKTTTEEIIQNLREYNRLIFQPVIKK